MLEAILCSNKADLDDSLDIDALEGFPIANIDSLKSIDFKLRNDKQFFKTLVK